MQVRKQNGTLRATNEMDLKLKDQPRSTVWRLVGFSPRQRLDSGRLPLLQLRQLLLQQVSFLPQARRVLHLSVQQAAKRPVQGRGPVSNRLVLKETLDQRLLLYVSMDFLLRLVAVETSELPHWWKNSVLSEHLVTLWALTNLVEVSPPFGKVQKSKGVRIELDWQIGHTYESWTGHISN